MGTYGTRLCAGLLIALVPLASGAKAERWRVWVLVEQPVVEAPLVFSSDPWAITPSAVPAPIVVNVSPSRGWTPVVRQPAQRFFSISDCVPGGT